MVTTDGVVKILKVVREPGQRAKIAVTSNDSNVDPVGACVGMKGSRVQAVVQELRGEKIDIISYTDVIRDFIEKALSPAVISRIAVNEEDHSALVVCDESQLALGIGKKGQNVRLASQLTGWRIDIHSESKVRELEEQAKRCLAEIEGVSEDLADTMFKLGWRSAEELANAQPQELVAIPGLGGLEVAQAITEAAKVTMGIHRKRAEAEARRLELEAQKTDEERMIAMHTMSLVAAAVA